VLCCLFGMCIISEGLCCLLEVIVVIRLLVMCCYDGYSRVWVLKGCCNMIVYLLLLYRCCLVGIWLIIALYAHLGCFMVIWGYLVAYSL